MLLLHFCSIALQGPYVDPGVGNENLYACEVASANEVNIDSPLELHPFLAESIGLNDFV
jgi:hypothetical protein